MIVMHAMQAPYDLPGIDIRRGDTMYHLLSNVPGPAGTAELLAFVRACGGRDSWVQSPGTYREHFDIFGEWAKRARALGAHLADGHEVAQILTQKRAAMQGAGTVPTLTSRQMRGLATLVTERYGITPAQRMELAALVMLTLIRQRLGADLTGRGVTVLAGPGRTGATGLVLARHLAGAGASVRVWLPTDFAALHADAVGALATVTALGIPTALGVAPPAGDVASAALLVDALLGYGTDGPPRDPIAAAIAATNAADVPCLALDLPSGLDPDDGGPAALCIRAAATLALGLPLRGLALGGAAGVMGDLWLADVGIPPRAPKRVGARVGHLFTAGSPVPLVALPLAGDALPSAMRQLRRAGTDDVL